MHRKHAPTSLHTTSPNLRLLLGRAVLVGSLATIGVVSGPGAAHAAGGSVAVAVSYAADYGHPVPWAGDFGVQFDGCTNCQLDAGVIEVINDSQSSVVVNSIVAVFGSCTFDIWAHDVSLNPRERYIVTDNGVTGSADCPNGGVFNPSDIGPNGQSWAGNCEQSGVIPLVTVTVDGAPVTLVDTNQVLNSGGIDGCGGSELPAGAPIHLLGFAACQGTSLTLNPSDQTQEIDDTATVTAHFVAGCGDPLRNAQVVMGAATGPNTQIHRYAVTDNNGDATVTYPGTVVGTDTWRAFAGHSRAGPSYVSWVIPETMTGRAYALSSTGLIHVTPTPDTGPIATTLASSTGSCRSTLAVGTALTARSLCANLTITENPDSSTGSASLANARLLLPRAPIVVLGTVSSTSTTTCAGSAGDVSIGYLRIGTRTIISSAVHPAPNTTYTIGGITIVLNEQQAGPGELTVNAVHVVIPNVDNLVIASSTSDIHDCP